MLINFQDNQNKAQAVHVTIIYILYNVYILYGLTVNCESVAKTLLSVASIVDCLDAQKSSPPTLLFSV